MSIQAQQDDRTGMARIVERNIDALLQRRKQEEKQKTVEEKVADKVTRFTGSMLFVYIHLALFGLWIIWNLGWLGLKPFDPSFVVLAMFASVEAIFLSTFVLISLISAIAKKMDIQEAYHPEIEELSKDVRPEKVMDTMEQYEKSNKK